MRLLCSVATAGHLVVRAEGDERQYARALDCPRQRTLVLRAHTRFATSFHLVTVRNEPPQPAHILIVDVLHLVHAKGANLPTRIVPGPAAPALEATLSTSSASERRPASPTRSRTSRPCRPWCCGRCGAWCRRRFCGRRICGLFCRHEIYLV